jgi:hypothetical protein
MIIILTRPPKIFFKGAVTYWLKAFARKALGKTRGPEGVLQSLKRGLSELSVSYRINARPGPTATDTVHVISNIEALHYAIKEKRAGRIAKLIAGPNLVVSPNEHDNVLASPEIDALLIVSPWVMEIYKQDLPQMMYKAHIWPAGVRIPPTHDASDSRSAPHDKKHHCIVFMKNAPQQLFDNIVAHLKAQNIDMTILTYGDFKQQDYFAALRRTDFVVYLQEFESQGIALQETWAHDVPTLVWNKGRYETVTGHAILGNVAAPYLTDETGMLFGNSESVEESTEDFRRVLPEFLARLGPEDRPGIFSPRTYCLEHLSDKASAKTYLDIVSKIQP